MNSPLHPHSYSIIIFLWSLIPINHTEWCFRIVISWFINHIDYRYIIYLQFFVTRVFTKCLSLLSTYIILYLIVNRNSYTICHLVSSYTYIVLYHLIPKIVDLVIRCCKSTNLANDLGKMGLRLRAPVGEDGAAPRPPGTASSGQVLCVFFRGEGRGGKTCLFFNM